MACRVAPKKVPSVLFERWFGWSTATQLAVAGLLPYLIGPLLVHRGVCLAPAGSVLVQRVVPPALGGSVLVQRVGVIPLALGALILAQAD